MSGHPDPETRDEAQAQGQGDGTPGALPPGRAPAIPVATTGDADPTDAAGAATAALAAPPLLAHPPAGEDVPAAEAGAEGAEGAAAEGAAADEVPEGAPEGALDAARPSLEQRVAALKGDALKEEVKRVFGTATGGVKGVAAQRDKLLAAWRAEEAGDRIPGQWAEGMMPDPNPGFAPPEGEEEGPKGEAASVMADEDASPLDFFLLFFTASMIGAPGRTHTPIPPTHTQLNYFFQISPKTPHVILFHHSARDRRDCAGFRAGTLD